MNRSRPAGKRFVPFLALFFGAAALAYGGIFVRQSELPPTASAVYRVGFAVPVLLLFRFLTGLAPREQGAREGLGRRRLNLVLVGVIFSGNLALYHWSIMLTTLANAALLANLAPLFVVLGSWLLFGQRFTTTFIVGLATALTGTIVLIGARVDLGMTHVVGGVFGIVTAAFYGAYLLAVNRVRAQSDTATVMMWSSVGTFLVLLPITWALGEPLVPHSLHGVLMLIALAVISHVGGQGSIAYALAHLPAAMSSVTLLVQPVMAAAFGWLLLGEHPRIAEYFAGLVVLAGIVIARRGSSAPKEERAEALCMPAK